MLEWLGLDSAGERKNDNVWSGRAASAADASGLVQTALSKVTQRSNLGLDARVRAPGHSR